MPQTFFLGESLNYYDYYADVEKISYFEIVYAAIIKVNDEVKEKKDLEKIILCDVPTKLYPDLEINFLNLINNSGYPSIKLEKKIDFYKLYNERFN